VIALSGRARIIAVAAAGVAVAAAATSYVLVANAGSTVHGSPSGGSTNGVPSRGGAPGAATTPPVSNGGPTQLNAALCKFSHSGLEVAATYVGAAESGLAASAQSCVYRNTVTLAVTRSIAGKLYAPLTTDARASVIQFGSTDGLTRLAITTAKESDGHYYVVGVTRH